MKARGYLSPPAACESLAGILPRFSGSIEARGSGYLARLPGGRVYGSGIVLSPDGATIIADLTHDFGTDGEGLHWLQGYRQIRPPVRLDGRTAVVAVNLGSGYAHWLLEELPRWLSLRPDDADAVIAHTGASFIREVLQDARFPWRVIPVGRHSHFECETLLIPNLVEPDARMVEALTTFARPHIQSDSVHGEKLYITRDRANRRRVLNEAALWSQLEARGFAKVRLEELSWKEQVSAFARAREIVAPHGAGLANLVFCAPGTRVVEFLNPDYVNLCFQRLAELKGLDHHVQFSPANRPARCLREAGRRDIEADVPAILRSLS